MHIDEGFDFLGYRIQRRRKRGTNQRRVYTYPSKKSILTITRKVRALTHKSRYRCLTDLLQAINPAIRGWCAYFRYGVSKATFSYLDSFAWRRVVWWIRKRHPKTALRTLRRRYLPRWRPTEGEVTLYNAAQTVVSRYRYRGTRIPTPWKTASSTA